MSESNFSPAECTLLLELAEKNLSVIREKFSNTLNNKMKANVWKSITDKVNAIGVAKRTTGEIKDKWRRPRFCSEKGLQTSKTTTTANRRRNFTCATRGKVSANHLAP